MMSRDNKPVIPIFFATDNNYVPFLAVAIKSLLINASSDYFYNIHVLTEGLDETNIDQLNTLKTDNCEIIINDVSKYVRLIKANMDATLRDYYTTSIFYRIFIASMFRRYDKAIYLDCDICVVGDISKMYNIEIGDNIFGCVIDEIVSSNPVLHDYARNAVGVEPSKYFNSGVLLINLKKYREEKIERKFVELMVKYNFQTIAPDQDYLNVLCKDKVFYMDAGWDKMTLDENLSGELHLIHYNMFKKPWLFDNVLYEEYFWKYAKLTPFYTQILSIKNSAPKDIEQKGIEGLNRMIQTSQQIVNSSLNFKKILEKK